MSGIGNQRASLLPEDIEKRLAEVKLVISTLEGTISASRKDAESAANELSIVTNNLNEARQEHSRIIASNEGLLTGMKDREATLSQKESALNVYAIALEEKEKKINKYLAIFENMKDVIRK